MQQIVHANISGKSVRSAAWRDGRRPVLEEKIIKYQIRGLFVHVEQHGFGAPPLMPLQIAHGIFLPALTPFWTFFFVDG